MPKRYSFVIAETSASGSMAPAQYNRPDMEEEAREEPKKPDRVEEAPDREGGARSAITQPSKLIRIATMTRAMLSEVREAQLDEGGRHRLMEIHERTIEEMKEVLSDDLRDELSEIFLPLSANPSDAELRVAQAQLVGWLEGLFAGIQASLVSQQLAAQHQLAEMRKAPQLESGEGEYPGVYL
jgi:hypothetical protein